MGKDSCNTIYKKHKNLTYITCYVEIKEFFLIFNFFCFIKHVITFTKTNFKNLQLVK